LSLVLVCVTRRRNGVRQRAHVRYKGGFAAFGAGGMRTVGGCGRKGWKSRTKWRENGGKRVDGVWMTERDGVGRELC
jgi:hypothetical protein